MPCVDVFGVNQCVQPGTTDWEVLKTRRLATLFVLFISKVKTEGLFTVKVLKQI